MKQKIILMTILILLASSYIIRNNNTIYTSKVVSNMKKYNSSKNTFEHALDSKEYKDTYAKNYQEINYVDKDNFINEINTLLNIGYDSEEINQIFKNVNNSNISKILNSSKLELENYYDIKNFEVDKISQYEEYQVNNNCSLEEAVLKVNIGLDHDFYTQVKEIEDKDSYTVLVNKYNYLGDYEPSDLKPLSYSSEYMLREEARDSFEKLISRAKLDNVYIRPYSAYRSFLYQSSIYNTYIDKDGLDIADTYSARPGYSEHQTGLSVDVWTEGLNYITDSDAKWLKDNSYKYGFIVRYTKENENITGYIEEPWHLRYLGVEVATDVVKKNLTYDEYYDLYIKK